MPLMRVTKIASAAQARYEEIVTKDRNLAEADWKWLLHAFSRGLGFTAR